MASAYFRLFPLEWLGQVRMLSPDEIGVYFTLTLMMLEREGPLPVDMKRTARALRTSPKALTAAVEALIEQRLIWETDDGFMSDFVQQELQRTEEIRKKNSRAANMRWEKKVTKSTSDGYARNARAMRTQSHTSPVQSSSEPALQAGDLSSASSTSQTGAPPPLAESSRRRAFDVGDEIPEFGEVVDLLPEGRVLTRSAETGEERVVAFSPDGRPYDPDEVPF